MLVMVQREVAQRMVAGPGDDAYGAVSVKVAYWATGGIVGSVPPTVFLPQPTVDSSLVEIVRRGAPAVPDSVDRPRLFQLVSAGFGQRRKMLRRSLASLVDPEAFAAAGVRPEARAEELGLDDWARLAAASPTRPRRGSLRKADRRYLAVTCRPDAASGWLSASSCASSYASACGVS